MRPIFWTVGVGSAALVCVGCDGGDAPVPPAAGGSAEAESAQVPAVDVGAPWFEERAAQAGIEFTHRSGHRDDYYMPEIMGGGAALFDADGDGDLDAYLVQGGDVTGGRSGARPDGNRLFRNQLFRNGGDGTFEDATAGSGSDDAGYGMGVACGDVEGDGDTDLYVTNVGPNALLVNDGTGRFESSGHEDGVDHRGWGTSAAFFDLDRDGALDLFVVNYLAWSASAELPCYNKLSVPDYCSPKNYEAPAADVLYRNAGSGRFEDVSVASGVAAVPGTGLGIGCGDFDGDGWTDVFVANDGMPDALWKNGGDGTVSDVAALAGCAVDEDGLHKAGMGVAVADVDVDGDLDLAVCNLERESDSVYLNQGGYFVDRTSRAGLGTHSRPFTRFGMAWHDFDHDGVLDLFQANGRVNRQSRLFADDPYAEPNLLFRGAGEARFEPVEPAGGTEPVLVATSRAAAFGDVNGDGALDVLVVNRDSPAHLLVNRAGAGGHWLLLRVLETSGSDALGATVFLRAGGHDLRRDVRAAYSYLASNDPRVHVGLGTVPRVTDVRVRWADGTEEGFGDLAANEVHVLRRGDSAVAAEKSSDD